MVGYRTDARDDPNHAFSNGSWVIVIGLGTLFSVVLGLALPDAAQSTVGFILTAEGLVISLVGFSFTIWQLIRTQRATSAATAALESARRQFGTLDVLGELHTLRSASESVRDNILALRWPAVTLGYDRLRERMMRITSAPDQLTNQENEIAKDFVAHLISASIEAESLNTGDPSEGVSWTRLLRQMEDFSLQVEYRVKDEFRGS